MAEHPDILARVRAEQLAVRGKGGARGANGAAADGAANGNGAGAGGARGAGLDATLSGEDLAEMPFTRQVVKEVLRFRPPAPMVPQVAMRPFKLTDGYTAPKGAFIIPDIVSACHQGFSNAKEFDPDRFGCALFL